MDLKWKLADLKQKITKSVTLINERASDVLNGDCDIYLYPVVHFPC